MAVSLRVRSRKTVPKSLEFESGRLSPFLGTCSYGDGTWTTVAIRGDRPSAVVVRCPSVAVALRYRRRQLATGGVPDRPAVARLEKNVKEPVLLHDSPAANTIDLVNVSV